MIAIILYYSTFFLVLLWNNLRNADIADAPEVQL